MITFWEPISGESYQFDYFFKRVNREIDADTYLIQCIDAKELLERNQKFSKEKNFIFYYTEELVISDDNDFDVIWSPVKKIIENFSIPEHKITFIINYYSKSGPSGLTRKFMQSHFGNVTFVLLKYFEFKTGNIHKFLPQSFNQTYNYGKKNYLILGGKPFKYNRIPVGIDLYQQGLLKNSICTFYKEDLEQTLAFLNTEDNSYNPTLVEAVIEHTSKSVDGVALDLGWNGHYQGYPYDHRLYEKTKLSLVLETHFTDHRVFVTEKTARAIYNHHPFVIFSSPHFLKELQSQGYQTFADLTDESYDSTLGASARRYECIESVINFNYDVNKIIEITNHNKKNFDKIYQEEVQKIIDINKYYTQNSLTLH